MAQVTDLLKTPSQDIAPNMGVDEGVRRAVWILNQLPNFIGGSGTSQSQPTNSFTITPSDTTNLTPSVTKGIFVSVPSGASTTVAFKLTGDSTSQSITLLSQQYLPGSFARVMSTGTTLNGATIVGYGG